MKNHMLLPVVAAALTILGSPLFAAGELGQTAGPLKITEWVKGKAVDLSEAKGKQVVVVEFWATWCGPCRTSIPHLTELQKKYKDKVVFVGVSDEDSDTVKKFVEKMGEKMDYTVAIDNDNATSKAYMTAFNQNGIPHAFIVDKESRIVWHGHPMADLDKAIDEVLAGKLDLETAKRRDGAQAKVQEFLMAAQKGDETKARELGKELEALDAEIGGISPTGEKFDTEELLKMMKFQTAVRSYQTALMSGKSNEALAKMEASLKEIAPKDFDLEDFKSTMQLQMAFSQYYSAAAGYGDASKLPELADKVVAVKCKNSRMLNELAWALLTDERIKQRDYALASKLAKAAVDASEAKEVAALDTYARALFESGKVREAMDWQQKAIAASEDDQEKKELEVTLARYKAKAAVE